MMMMMMNTRAARGLFIWKSTVGGIQSALSRFYLWFDDVILRNVGDLIVDVFPLNLKDRRLYISPIYTPKIASGALHICPLHACMWSHFRLVFFSSKCTQVYTILIKVYTWMQLLLGPLWLCQLLGCLCKCN